MRKNSNCRETRYGYNKLQLRAVYRFEFDDQLSIIGHANLVPRFSLLPGNEVVAMQ